MKQSFLLNERNIKIIDAGQISSDSFTSLLPEKEMPQFYFVARQSKSRRLFLFDANRLAHSNANLVRKDSIKLYHSVEFSSIPHL